MTVCDIVRPDVSMLVSVACWVCAIHCGERVLSRRLTAASLQVLPSYFLLEPALRMNLSSL